MRTMQKIAETPAFGITMFVIVMSIFITAINIFITEFGGGYFTLETKVYASISTIATPIVLLNKDFIRQRFLRDWPRRINAGFFTLIILSGPIVATWKVGSEGGSDHGAVAGLIVFLMFFSGSLLAAAYGALLDWNVHRDGFSRWGQNVRDVGILLIMLMCLISSIRLLYAIN